MLTVLVGRRTNHDELGYIPTAWRVSSTGARLGGELTLAVFNQVSLARFFGPVVFHSRVLDHPGSMEVLPCPTGGW